ncbi:MAG: DUF4832 domain-containing protein [Cyclobacteriaceae bacterium]|nr:DUF4832 domain-containing protein [Cyclobacteriaceae bacterium]
MKKGIAFSLAFSLLSTFCIAQTTINYDPDLSNIPNPERGFYHHTETHSNNYTFLNSETLASYRNDGITLILRVFYLEAFKEGAISNTYLENMQKDFLEARKAGVKVVVRFAYTSKSTAPYGDAPLDIVLQHISQLQPVLRSNSDVIALFQAGFIGAWGEWYYTDYFSNIVGSPNAEDWINRRALVNAFLEAVPENRMIQVRTPKIKMSLLEDETPIAEADAYNGTAKARLAHHNDCFVASETDYGTYVDIPTEKAYLEAETKYLVMGGETCNLADPYSYCPNAVSELERFHWSFLNIDYNQTVLNVWKEDACFEEVQLNLGYRYRLVDATVTSEARPGDKFSVNVNLVNDGWSNVYNERKFEFVLINNTTNKEYYFETSEDPRLWSIDNSNAVNLTVGIPGDIEPGDYSVFINLPDPEPSLYGNPNYSIRLANTDMWNSQHGYNDLGIDLNISTSNSGNTYTGDDFFQERMTSTSEPSEIIVDGGSSDWGTITSSFESMGNLYAKSIKLYNSADSLYFLIEGQNLNDAYQIFLDLDQSATTGYHAWQWTNNGADLLIENGILYDYSGTGNAWGWTVNGNSNSVKNSDVIELGIPLSLLDGHAEINFAFVSDPNNTIDDNYLPDQNSDFLTYRLFLSMNRELFSGQDQNKLLLYWGKTEEGVIRTIERSENASNYTIIATIDGSVDSYTDYDVSGGIDYSYRYYLRKGEQISQYSSGVTVSTNDGRDRYYNIVIDGLDNDWFAIPPLATQQLNNKAYFIRSQWGSAKANFIFSSVGVDSYAIFMDTDANGSTGGSTYEGASNGGYDYLIKDGDLFKYNSGNWESTGNTVEEVKTSHLDELSIPLSNLDNLGDNALINMNIFLVNGIDTAYLPSKEFYAAYVRTLPSAVPESFSIRKSEELPKSRLILTWTKCYDCDGYILERSLDGIDFNEITSLDAEEDLYRDDNLEDETTYFYRMYSYTDIGPSGYTDIVSETTGEEVLGFRSELEGMIQTYPNPVGNMLTIKTELYPGVYQVRIMQPDGRVVKDMSLKISGNNASFSLDGIENGVYILVVTKEDINYQTRFLKLN